MSKSKYSMKEIAHLLEMHNLKNTELKDMFEENLEGSGTRMAAVVLYSRLVAMALDTTSDTPRWFVKPQRGLSRPNNVEAFMREELPYGIQCEDLLRFASPATFAKIMRFFLKSEIIKVDRFNKMHVHYPVNGKLLSLVYAAKAIKSSYKKNKDEETSLDTPDGKVVQLGGKQVDLDDPDFWDK